MITIERSRVDNRWCVDTPTAETLCPLWMVPFIVFVALLKATPSAGE